MPQYLACNTFPAVYKVWKYPSSAAAAANGGSVCVCMCACMLICPYMHTLMYTHLHVFMFLNRISCSPAWLQTPSGAKDG